jgi:hypothetical protein
MNSGQTYRLAAHSPTHEARAVPLSVGYVSNEKVFSLIRSLPSSLSADDVRLCSNDSSVLCRGVTPRRRTRGPCGLSLRPPTCCLVRQQVSPSLPVLVHEVSRRAWGLRLRRTEQELALSFPSVLPSAHFYRVGVRVVCFRSSIAHPAYTPIYASLRPSR